MANNDESVTATCHCGAIKVVAPRKPALINECQCTVCRSYGAAWAYYHPSEIKIIKRDGFDTKAYARKDRAEAGKIEFHHCTNCGCVAYWWPVDAEKTAEMGLNTRLIPPELLMYIERHISYEDFLT